MKLNRKRSKTMESLESLDNRIRLQTLEKQINYLERVIADLEFEDQGNITHRNTLQQALTEACQIYSSLHKDRDLNSRDRQKSPTQ